MNVCGGWSSARSTTGGPGPSGRATASGYVAADGLLGLRSRSPQLNAKYVSRTQKSTMSTTRWDETWHRLREWTNDQAPSERLAAQILLADGFSGLDPSHPLGGKDGGKDAVCTKNGSSWVMGVYFPRGQQSFGDIKRKYTHDFQTIIFLLPYVFVRLDLKPL